MNRPCPHRDDEACSICVEHAALKAEVARLRAQLAPRLPLKVRRRRRPVTAFQLERRRRSTRDEWAERFTMTSCAYYRGVGICSFGCYDEPRCMTNEPMEGWIPGGPAGRFSVGAPRTSDLL